MIVRRYGTGIMDIVDRLEIGDWDDLRFHVLCSLFGRSGTCMRVALCLNPAYFGEWGLSVRLLQDAFLKREA